MFRNAVLFRFSSDVAVDLGRLASALDIHRLRSCGPLELVTRGFVSPRGMDDDGLTLSVGDCTQMAIGTEEKILPPSVINDEVGKRVRAITAEHGRAVGGRERKRIKAEVIDELLTRAFVRRHRLDAYADRAHGWMVFDTASPTAAEKGLTAIREALGTFPALPLASERSPRQVLTEWLTTGQLPPGLALGDACELRDPATPRGARWKGQAADLQGEEVHQHLRAGMQVYRLGLTFDNRIRFVLGEDLVVRKLAFFDVVTDTLGEQESAAAALDAETALMTLELARLLEGMAGWFGIPRP